MELEISGELLRTSGSDRGARRWHQPPGPLPATQQATEGPSAAADWRRRGDPRRRAGEPNGWDQDARGSSCPGAWAARQSQEGASPDGRASAPTAPPATWPAAPAGVLPRRAARSALAHGHDLDLEPSTAGAISTRSSTAAPARSPAGALTSAAATKKPWRSSNRPLRTAGSSPAPWSSAPTTAPPTPAARSALDSPSWVSRTAAAATATPNPRRSSSPGSQSSKNAASGAKSLRPSATPAKRSAATSTATTTGPTHGWPTKPRAKSRPYGKMSTKT